MGACECVSENACRWVDVYISTVYSFTSSTPTSTPAVGPPKSYTRKKKHAEQYPACSEEPRTKLPKVAGMLLLSQRVIEKNVTQLPVWCCEEHTSWLWPHIPRCHHGIRLLSCQVVVFTADVFV